MSNLKLNPIFSQIQPFTTLDFKNHLSLILFTKGCNFRCKYCYNPQFVTKSQIETLEIQKIKDFLIKRRKVLDGVVICGGEPTIHNKNLINWLKYIKSLNYKIKLDTNGTNLKLLKEILNQKLIDSIAIDYKAPIKKYKNITQTNNFQNIQKSIKLILENKIDYEIRTTIQKDLHSKKDVEIMILELKELGVKNYAIQNFLENKQTIGNLIKGKFSDKELDLFKEKLNGEFETSEIRT